MIMYITAKCNDMSDVSIQYPDGTWYTHIGYAPEVAGLMGGDYVDFGVDLETGKIKNWDTVVKPAIVALLENNS